MRVSRDLTRHDARFAFIVEYQQAAGRVVRERSVGLPLAPKVLVILPSGQAVVIDEVERQPGAAVGQPDGIARGHLRYRDRG